MSSFTLTELLQLRDPKFGEIGFTGSQGEIGFTGSQGEIGFTGSQGDIGFTGSQGPGANQSLDTSSNVRFASLGVNTDAYGTAGEIRATNNITAFFSDDRLKIRLEDINNAMEKINTLSGFYFEPNKTAQDLGYEVKRDVGVSAQKVQDILPEAVVPAPIDEKYLTVRYEKLIPLLIEGIKEQQLQIEELRDMLLK